MWQVLSRSGAGRWMFGGVCHWVACTNNSRPLCFPMPKRKLLVIYCLSCFAAWHFLWTWGLSISIFHDRPAAYRAENCNGSDWRRRWAAV